MDEFQLLETVVATVDTPEEGILAGDLGTINPHYRKNLQVAARLQQPLSWGFFLYGVTSRSPLRLCA